MSASTSQPTGSGYGPVYDQMVADRARWVAEFEAFAKRHQKNMDDIDAAIAAVVARQPAPTAPQVERRQCREQGCGGWLVIRDNTWVHERDGGLACKPGHSGPVAQPLDQTAKLPTVAPPSFDPATNIWHDGDVKWHLNAPLVDHAGDVWEWRGDFFWEWRGDFFAGFPVYTGHSADLPLSELLHKYGPLDYRDRSAEVSDQVTDQVSDQVTDQVTATPAQAEAGE